MNTTHTNRLLEPFDLPPFAGVQLEDYLPAIEHWIKQAQQRIEQIASQPVPNFENCIEALEFATKELDQVTTLFFNLNHAHTNEQMQALALEISPVITKFSNDIYLNDTLFEKVDEVFAKKETLGLTEPQNRLLEKTRMTFVRNGAALSADKKERYRIVSEELANLSLLFSQNALNATNDYTLHLKESTQLAGLPQYVIEIGESEAKAQGKEGWVFSLQAYSYIPFMQFSAHRALREEMWTQYNSRCFGGQFDNCDNIRRIVNLRLELAKLFGYNTFAAYALEERMSKTQQTVEQFLQEMIGKSEKFAQKDVAEIIDYARKEGFEEPFMPWDFAFYGEKLKKERFTVSDEELKPYFPLDSIRKGLFDTIETLYGISFRSNNQIDTYQQDVEVYEVLENGAVIAILFVDYFPRASKSGGAWMTTFREHSRHQGMTEIPIVSVVCNFSKPTDSKPSLLTFQEVTTLFHEFGHALHAIFAESDYPSIGGTNVAWDFVELPSQIMENWAEQPEFLSKWALHYQTGAPIPQHYIDNAIAANNFISGYAQMRQLCFGSCDMGWHTITTPFDGEIKPFEDQSIAATQVLPKSDKNCISPTFSHIFAGGYAAGYYSYKWAEILEADAFSLFKEKGIYDKACAASFRKNILSKGDLYPAMELYKNFRGRAPQSDALFEKLGMTDK